MGLVLDIIPNHMGIATPENVWWWDVLTHGPKSRHAVCFDINWEATHEGLEGKILLPVLGEEYEALVKRGAFQLLYEEGTYFLAHNGQRFPIAHHSVAGLPTGVDELKKFNADPAALDRLIRQQHYRLEFHEHGDARLNYRRFFAVSSLAAVRVEDEAVFERPSVHPPSVDQRPGGSTACAWIIPMDCAIPNNIFNASAGSRRPPGSWSKKS